MEEEKEEEEEKASFEKFWTWWILIQITVFTLFQKTFLRDLSF